MPKYLNIQQVQALEETHANSVKPHWLRGRAYNFLQAKGYVLAEEKSGLHTVTGKGYKELYKYWRDRYNRLEKEVIKP